MAERIRGRLARWLLRFGVAAAAAVGFLAVWIFWPRGSRIPVSAETTYLLKPLDADGYVDYVAAAGPPPDALENAAAWYVPVATGQLRAEMGAARFTAACEKVGITVDPSVQELSEFEAYAAAADTPPARSDVSLTDESRRAADGPWADAECPTVATWIDAHDAAIDRIVEGTRRPTFRFAAGSAGPDSVLAFGQSKRLFARALVARSMRRLGHDDFEGAAADIDAAFALARHTNPDPPLIESLIAAAVEATALDAERQLLAHLSDEPKVCERLRQIEARPPLTAPADAVRRGERFLLLTQWQRLDRLARGRPSDEPAVFPPNLGGRAAALRLDTAYASRETNRLFDLAVDALEAAPADRPRHLASLKTAIALRPPAGIAALLDREGVADMMLSLMRPALDVAVRSAVRIEARDRLQRVFASGRLFELGSGRPSATPEDLVPRYLARWPTDPFNGQPMPHATAESGWTVFAGGETAAEAEADVRFGDAPADDVD